MYPLFRFITFCASTGLLIAFFACNNVPPPSSAPVGAATATPDTTSTASADSIQPVWGYRFVVNGDFDGDGRQDTLFEHYYSKRDRRETNKFYSGISDIFVNFDSAHAKLVHGYISCTNPLIDKDTFYNTDSGVGILFLQNEGDLDGDGGDEISFVSSREQMSSMNSCAIYSFKNGKWKNLLSFEIREWEIPPTPDAGMAYGMFGNSGTYTTPANDTLNQQLAQDLKGFHFVQKLGKGKIKYHTFTEMADDTTMQVDLRY